MSIPDSIRRRRVHLGLTQRAFGERLGLSRLTISEWENAKRHTYIEWLPEIAKALETDISSLLSNGEVGPDDLRDIARRLDEHAKRRGYEGLGEFLERDEDEED